MNCRPAEWGWKIQFLDRNVGFVSVECFDLGVILATEDGGVTWERRVVNDPQGNANIEGVGFFLTKRWVGVGGWGDRDFQGGCSSATVDGGNTWRDANEIGRFINRFRFIGRPPIVGYASGDTVYKYSSDAPERGALQGFPAVVSSAGTPSLEPK